ncbi:oxidation resistance protein 1a isoform X3 [Alosa alosa]|uniref:oxidation resistance protein 1a isoform X1 n=1 Tax=Alosa sapidissima TaxID=34773 RepID=UPI001C09C3EE|nr:oxidation resistance protein 1a isoform X1 [Alosa sapidissima]XP_048117734.1 oxidation resistance protein 1a isoform X3 [Alosa alosa]
MFSTKRLKKKSQSVDIASQGFSALIPGLQLNRASPPVAKASTFEVQENNATNSQRCAPRCAELKRGYTIDTGQKKSTEKKDGRRMSFQRPKGTMEYSVESRDTLNSIALKFDTTPNELVQLNKLFSRNVVPGQVLYVPDPEYVSSVGSSPSLSPVSPLSPTSSEADLEKVTDSDGPPRSEAQHPPVSLRQSRVVSSTSEEEEALTEKFLKINCKYLTDGKGVVGGVLLVTPNNIMFDPLRTDPLVLERGCEEYGIMCPLDEVQSAAVYREITDRKISESVPPELEAQWSTAQPPPELRLRDGGGYESASTAPRSTEGSISEDVFTESELSPIREELPSAEELRQGDKSSGASCESVQTVAQAEGSVVGKGPGPGSARGSASQEERPGGGEQSDTDSLTAQPRSSLGSELTSEEQQSLQLSTPTSASGKDQPDGASPGQGSASRPASQSSAPGAGSGAGECPGGAKLARDRTRDSESDVEELRKMWKSHTMQQAKEQRDNVQQKEPTEEAKAEGPAVFRERKRSRSHKFLCLRVGKPMKKTFLSNASASMQQYAQRDRKHEYWFAVPQERTDHLYVFFIQWSPDMYGDGLGGMSQEPGFMVVKKLEESDGAEEQKEQASTTDASDSKEWEVVSLTEYHRRIDALNSEDLRALCKRLQITTKEEVNSNHGGSITATLEPETFRPNLSEDSDLLEGDQIEKLAKHLPPRTIGYPWTLAYSTSKHGMSIKTLYRVMQGLDTPVLLVIKDADGTVFGALASEPFKVSEGFYGTGETFLFTFHPEFEAYKWTGDNLFFIKGDMDSLAFGGGSGEFGLWLDGDLYHGRSHSCKTFGNPMLSQKEDFVVQDIEIWSFE